MSLVRKSHVKNNHDHLGYYKFLYGSQIAESIGRGKNNQ